MIKSFATPFAAFAIAVSFAAPATADTPAFVSGGKLAVCTDPSFPPMEYFEVSGDREPVGFDVDMMRKLVEGWNVSLEILPMDFAGLLPSLEAMRCDAVISGMFVTEERKQKFDAVSYFNTATVLAAKAGSEQAATIEDLSGKTIAVQTGTAFVEMFETINADLKAKGIDPINVQLYPKASDGIQQVLIGRSYATTTQDTELAYRELQNPGALTSIFEFEDHQKFGVFIRKSDDDREAVFSALQQLEAEGVLGEIADRWRLNKENILVNR